jgi:8-oxo-dGTP pyrophosphatase MutT (NUDIX family)
VTATIHLGSRTVAADVIYRLAVKAIALFEGRVLLMRSAAGGDYKFPGGGVQHGEDVAEALSRELDEECGRVLVELGEQMLMVIERRPSSDRPGAMFEMESHYYRCVVAEADRPQRLDEYEKDLGLRPEWVSVSRAIEVNQHAVDAGRPAPWVARELTVLEWLLSSGSL